ncbi:MAG: FGGY-family carbohydrate kinase [Anaerolineaceae bacterium]|nr:FGGY-family carbohydrate kinase [Anaerolineaceae bacterium]
MSDESVILAMDLGTSGMKVALITVGGKVLGWDSEPVKLILTQDGGAEQDPQEWWQAFLKAAGRLVARGLTPLDNIKAVCCSTQGEGTIPVDQNGNALMNCVLWMDMRGEKYLKQQFKGLINVTGAGINNTLRWIRLTGGMPSMTGKDPAAHMLLIREAYPEVYARTYKFLNVLDFLNLKLTGRFTATFDSILTSWVTDNRDPDRIHYDADLVKRSGIDRDKLPKIVKCTDIIGELKCEVADVLGLKPGVKVVAGAIDNTAAAIGAGTAGDFDTHLYIGTSSWMAAHVPFKKTDIVSSMASVPCAVPGRYLLTALQATAGGNLTFLRDNIIYHKDELLQEADVPDIFKVLDQITERTPAGSNGVIYTPWIWGERAPVEDRTLRAGIYNLSLNNHREDIIRAFLEGIAMNTRWLMNPFEKFMGRKLQRINIVGGGAQSNVWCQIFADVLNVEIRQVSDPVQANARGAAWIGAVGLGEIKFGDLQALTQINRTYTPNAANRVLYDERFDIFKKIYKQMNGIYRKLNS